MFNLRAYKRTHLQAEYWAREHVMGTHTHTLAWHRGNNGLSPSATIHKYHNWEVALLDIKPMISCKGNMFSNGKWEMCLWQWWNKIVVEMEQPYSSCGLSCCIVIILASTVWYYQNLCDNGGSLLSPNFNLLQAIFLQYVFFFFPIVTNYFSPLSDLSSEQIFGTLYSNPNKNN